MRVVRAKSYETEDGLFDKIEVELDGDDLLPEEKELEVHLQPLLLEIRADQQLVMFLRRKGRITKEQADQENAELKAARRSVLSMSKTRVPARLTI